MIIGIGGVSRSGKSSLCSFLKNRLNKKTAEFHLDDYIKEYIDWDFYTKFPILYLCKIHKAFNMEHPNTYDFDRFLADIAKSGQENDIVIAEGFLVTYDPRIKNMLDKYIHITLSRNIFTQRRMKDFRSNLWYANHVWNSFMKRGNDYKDLNHIVINGDREIDTQAVLRFVCDQ